MSNKGRICSHRGRPLSEAHRAKLRARLLERSQPLEVRFWAKVDRSGGPDACWPWTARRKDTGYGQFGVMAGTKQRVVSAHRVAWEIAGNVLPVWPMVIDHTCKNRACQNVKHMRVVTQRINTLENSDCPHAKNAAKTECLRGHPFSPENTHWKRGGPSKRLTRTCIACALLARPNSIPLDPRTKEEAQALPPGRQPRRKRPSATQPASS